ncbi:MAG: hypothetical protein DMG24_06205 [Acidobacteria bacterium]|nr:MAG: hypothetical protein DMG24_06205 [Acidobacteriota bacterium]
MQEVWLRLSVAGTNYVPARPRIQAQIQDIPSQPWSPESQGVCHSEESIASLCDTQKPEKCLQSDRAALSVAEG